MDFVCKLYGNTYAVHVTVALVGVATLNLALLAPPAKQNMASAPSFKLIKLYLRGCVSGLVNYILTGCIILFHTKLLLCLFSISTQITKLYIQYLINKIKFYLIIWNIS